MIALRNIAAAVAMKEPKRKPRLGTDSYHVEREAGPHLTRETLDTLSNLFVKSPLTADFEGEIVLYRLLDTTRAFAAERLAESGDWDTSCAGMPHMCVRLCTMPRHVGSARW